MPVLDRFWWLRLFEAAILGLLAVFFGLIFWSSFSWTNGLDLGNMAYLVLIPLAFAGWAAYMVVQAFAARRRKRLRLALLHGEQSPLLATPPTSMLTPSTPVVSAPASGLPLSLLWRERWLTRLFISFGTLAFAWPMAMILGMALLVFLPSGLSHIVFGSALSFDIVWLGGVALPTPFVMLALGRRFGVVADEEGVRSVRPWRRSRLIRWSEARLIEVGEPGRRLTRFWGKSSGIQMYTLYGASGSVRWPAFARYSALTPRPIDVPPKERIEQQAALLATIQARTNLTPNSMDALLHPRSARPRPYPRPQQSSTSRAIEVAFSAFGFLSLVSLGASVVVTPLSNVPALNWAVALSLPVATGVPLLLKFARSFRRAQPETPPAGPLAHGQTYAWVEPGRRVEGLVASISGLALLVDALPALAMWFPTLARQVTGRPVQTTSGFGQECAYIGLFAAFIGLVVIFAGVNGIFRPIEKRVTLQDSGLFTNQFVRRGRTARREVVRIPWSQVLRVEWVPWPRPAGAYTITTRDSGILTLPAAGPWRTTPRHGEAETLIGPEALAVTIAARASVQLTRQQPMPFSLSTKLRWLAERTAGQQSARQEGR